MVLSQMQKSLSIPVNSKSIQVSIFRCHDHGREDDRGFCKDYSCDICFQCTIGKHWNHNIVNIEEIDKIGLDK